MWSDTGREALVRVDFILKTGELVGRLCVGHMITLPNQESPCKCSKEKRLLGVSLETLPAGIQIRDDGAVGKGETDLERLREK